jgi:hypothetical protein
VFPTTAAAGGTSVPAALAVEAGAPTTTAAAAVFGLQSSSKLRGTGIYSRRAKKNYRRSLKWMEQAYS